MLALQNGALVNLRAFHADGPEVHLAVQLGLVLKVRALVDERLAEIHRQGPPAAGDQKTLKDAIETIKMAVFREKGLPPAERIVVLKKETQAELAELRRLLGPGAKKRKRKKA